MKTRPRSTRCLIAVLALPLALVLLSAAPKKNKRNSAPLGVIGGTVFQSNGFLLRGASVTAVNQADPKLKGQAVTDRRGEFAIRVPAVESSYVVTAKAKGFKTEQKTTDVYEGQKSTVTFLLSPADRNRIGKR